MVLEGREATVTDLARIVGLGIVVSVLLTFLRKEMSSIGAQVSIAFVVIALLFLIEPLQQVMDTFVTLSERAQVRGVYMALVLKAVGIAYIASIGAELSRDAGESAIGSAVELAGKVFIFLLAVPVIAAILDALVGLLPG